eukprot:g26500.t2
MVLLTSSHRFLARGKAESFSLDHRAFTKNHKGRRLSLVSEDRVHQQGTERYIVAFTSGELSRADGVGIIFSSGLPRSSDIQKIISVFLNRTGRICSRINQRVTRIAASLPQIELGDILEVVNNMELHSLTFTLWAKTGTECSASVSYKEVASAMGFDRRPVQQHKAEQLEDGDYRFRLMEIKGDISQRVEVVRQVHSALENRGNREAPSSYLLSFRAFLETIVEYLQWKALARLNAQTLQAVWAV